MQTKNIEQTVRSFRVNKELLKKVKIYCATTGMKMSWVTNEALTRYLEEEIKKLKK